MPVFFLRRGLAAFKNVKRLHPLFMASFIIQAELEKTEFNLSLSYENELLRDFERTTSYLFQKIIDTSQTFFCPTQCTLCIICLLFGWIKDYQKIRFNACNCFAFLNCVSLNNNHPPPSLNKHRKNCECCPGDPLTASH